MSGGYLALFFVRWVIIRGFMSEGMCPRTSQISYPLTYRRDRYSALCTMCVHCVLVQLFSGSAG